ncbi:MAG: hypothetical protein ACFBSC_05275 [Microcoleaceae cyanobacterium]
MTRTLLRVFLSLIFVFILYRPLSSIAAPNFTTDANLTSNTGYTQLVWEPSGGPVTLQQATDSEFSDPQTIYQGNNTALFLSGLENGEYFYRLQAEDGTISTPVALEVKHYSIIEAWLWFALGAATFASIVFVILKGKEEEQYE